MRILRISLLLLLIGLMVACGSVATPTAPESADVVEEVEQPEESVDIETEEPEEVVEAATEEPEATATEVAEEVVEVATEEPEATATEEPGETTEAETAATTESTEDEAVVDEESATTILDFSDNPLIALSNPENGLVLFGEFHDSIGYACSTCHLVDTERKLIGPGLWNIATRAQTRVEGQDAVEYLFNSIAHPNDYLVEGYPENLMPQNWEEIYSTAQIYDIIAYLLTLQG